MNDPEVRYYYNTVQYLTTKALEYDLGYVEYYLVGVDHRARGGEGTRVLWEPVAILSEESQLYAFRGAQNHFCCPIRISYLSRATPFRTPTEQFQGVVYFDVSPETLDELQLEGTFSPRLYGQDSPAPLSDPSYRGIWITARGDHGHYTAQTPFYGVFPRGHFSAVDTWIAGSNGELQPRELDQELSTNEARPDPTPAELLKELRFVLFSLHDLSQRVETVAKQVDGLGPQSPKER